MATDLENPDRSQEVEIKFKPKTGRAPVLVRTKPAQPPPPPETGGGDGGFPQQERDESLTDQDRNNQIPQLDRMIGEGAKETGSAGLKQAKEAVQTIQNIGKALVAAAKTVFKALYGPEAVVPFVVVVALILLFVIAVAFLGIGNNPRNGSSQAQPQTASNQENALKVGIASGSDTAREQYIETHTSDLLNFINQSLTKAKAKPNPDQNLINLLERIQQNTAIIAEKGTGAGSISDKQDKLKAIRVDIAQLNQFYPEVFTAALNEVAEKIASLAEEAVGIQPDTHTCRVRFGVSDCKDFVARVVADATAGTTLFTKSANANGLFTDLQNGKYPGWKFIDLDAERPQRGDVMLCHRNRPGSSGEVHGHVAIYIGNEKTIAASYNPDPSKGKKPHVTGNSPGLPCEKSSRYSGYQAAARYQGS